MIALGFDTSNYTTSVAWFDGTTGGNAGRLLTVKSGELGLRQSDALFQHVQRLPVMAEQLKNTMPGEKLCAIGASERPRSQEGSYMPCFMAGASQAGTMATLTQTPYYGFSHQEGHLAAVLWSAGCMDLLEQEFLAWHLSGGTTELLHVQPGLRCEIIGGTEDLSAGQLIDRTGKLLGLDFPAGKALDVLSKQGSSKPFAVKLHGLSFSLSGMQNKAEQLLRGGASPADVAAFSLGCIVDAVFRTTEEAQKTYGMLPVVFSGGVSSNGMLRQRMEPMGAIFGAPEYSTDNAMGIAVLAWRKEDQRYHG